MEKLHFSIIIKAPMAKVWTIMLGDETYRRWTEPFAPGSYYVGTWQQGSRMLFLAPGKTGESGMVSRIIQVRPYEYLCIEHLGVIRNGVQDTSSDEVMSWSGAREEYRLSRIGDATEVLVALDANDKIRKMLLAAWPKALKKLKYLAEKKERVIAPKRVKRVRPGAVVSHKRGKR